MSPRQRSVILVTLKASDNIRDLQKKISRIAGVKNVEYDNLTYKLLVRYESDDAGKGKIEKQIDELLEDHKVKRKRLSSRNKKASSGEKATGQVS